MTTLASTLRRPRFGLPRLTWRRLLRWLAAHDALYRERARLAVLDHRTLRDIGVTRADLDAALRSPDDHLRLIRLRGGDQFQH